MKVALLALALALPAGDRSLGIGIDVLPEAFGFAARRVGFTPDLRLASCTESGCLWDLGQGVRMEADHPADSLYVTRIEVRRAPGLPDAPGWTQACLAIVALVSPGATVAEQRATAQAIARGAPPPTDLAADRSVGFYGSPVRCGAAAM